MSLESVKGQIEQKLSMAGGLSAKVKFDFGDDGLLLIDSTQSPAVVSHDDEEADLVITCALSVFEDVLSGTQDPNIAFMMGKLKIKGSMGLAMKLTSILED